MRRNPKLIDKWSSALSPAARAIVEQLVVRADRAGGAAYLVGGPVRDLLLGTPSLDTDIVVEGDAIALARTFEGEPDVRVVTHATFRTATLRLPGGTVDIITARAETYARPGALPSVTPATITADLARRDFTINAMALGLTAPNVGELLDPHDGEADLRAGLIRALHERSFQDDATRILRAARYEARLGFRIEPQAEACIRRDVRFLDTISASRVHHELARILSELAPEGALSRLQDLGAFAAIDPSLADGNPHAFRELRSYPAAPRAAMWALLLWDLATGEAPRVVRRLALTSAQREAALAIPLALAAAKRLGAAKLRPSDVMEALETLPEPTLWALAAHLDAGPAKDHVLDYLLRLRRIRPLLRGDDVIALGVPRGPGVGEVLRLLKAAKLNGELRTRRDEARFVKDYLSRSSR